MMNRKCRKFKNHFMTSASGFTDEQNQAFEMHLKTCGRCRAKLEQEKKLDEWLTELAGIKPKPTGMENVKEGIMLKIRQIEKSKSNSILIQFEKFVDWFSLPLVKPVMVGMAVGLMVYFSVIHWNDQNEIQLMESRLQKVTITSENHEQLYYKYLEFKESDSSFTNSAKWMKLLFSKNQKVHQASINLPSHIRINFLKTDSQSIFRENLKNKNHSKTKKFIK
ncbi:MAG: hypothetical protein U0W24_16920 [Bacteroidales bacterium]